MPSTGRRKLSAVETVVVLAGLAVLAIAVAVLGPILGLLIGIPLFIGVLAVPVALAVRAQSKEDRQAGRPI